MRSIAFVKKSLQQGVRRDNWFLMQWSTLGFSVSNRCLLNHRFLPISFRVLTQLFYNFLNRDCGVLILLETLNGVMVLTLKVGKRIKNGNALFKHSLQKYIFQLVSDPLIVNSDNFCRQQYAVTVLYANWSSILIYISQYTSLTSTWSISALVHESLKALYLFATFVQR